MKGVSPTFLYGARLYIAVPGKAPKGCLHWIAGQRPAPWAGGTVTAVTAVTLAGPSTAISSPCKTLLVGLQLF